MRKLLGSVAVIGAVFWAVAAHAVPIAAGSELSINGSDNFTQTQINFTGSGNVGGTQGDFNVLVPCTACVTMIASISAGTTGTLYNVIDGAFSSTLVLNNDEQLTFTPGPTPAQDALEITGTGILTLTGRDATPGNYVVTTQGPTNAAVTFSATSSALAVPEPAATAIFAMALLAMGLVVAAHRRRRD
ncbi:MAG: hypothetical protein C5B60_02625 [Chloroflexi bacterium]|nr:MAG: hypothetical protein C5B60_02625 [Chloroflexota bacterium]